MRTLTVGTAVRSLVTFSHGQHTVGRGLFGKVVRGCGDGGVIIDFGHTVMPLKSHQVCRPEEFAEQSRRQVGSHHVGDRVRSLKSDPCWRPQPLSRGDEGVIECQGSTQIDVVVFFGHTSGQLKLCEICRPEEFLDYSSSDIGPYSVGERVLSLKTVLHWRPPLFRGSEGVVDCCGLTGRDVVVNFGHVSGQLKLHQLCRPTELEHTVGSRVGPYRVGDRVCSLRSCPDWRPCPLEVGQEGVIECYGSSEEYAVVNFGHVSGQLTFDSIFHHSGAEGGPEHRGLKRMRMDTEWARSFPVSLLTMALPDPCSICLQNMVEGEEVRRLPCLHVFHQGCIDAWLQTKARCPVDNVDLWRMFLQQRRVEGKGVV